VDEAATSARRASTDEPIGRNADLWAQDDNCRKRTNDLTASMRRTGADMPDRWLFLPMLT
jgi:hypothetical protein